jgi:spermidine synthase
MSDSDWLQENYAAINHRLRWLRDQPTGILYQKRTKLHDILIHKAGTQIHFVYRDPISSEIMSRVDLQNPLNLLAPYTRGLILSLLWVSEPQNVYVIGFGGGRLPMLLHHYFPKATIDSTDIEPVVAEIANKFFGIEFDSRMRLFIQDGRTYIEHLNNDTTYDTILLDGFRGVGYGPYSLSTIEFYESCKAHLGKNGVVLANFLSGDQLYNDKLFTFSKAFDNVYFFKHDTGDVMIGTVNNNGVKLDELIRRASQLQKQHAFPFSIIEEANHIVKWEELLPHMPELRNACLLTDANPPDGYFDSLSSKSTIFKNVNRNDICPCGSGRKFKHCHGRSRSTSR